MALLSDSFPFTKYGTCLICGESAEQLWHSKDWWHNAASSCDGRIGYFIEKVKDDSKMDA